MISTKNKYGLLIYHIIIYRKYGTEIMNSYRIALTHRPPLFRDGEKVFYVQKKLVERNSEVAVTLSLICNRRLFGQCYGQLMPKQFYAMGKHSGVMIFPFAPSTSIIPQITFPGDIDLLLIPYDNNELIVSETLAIEIKIVRARYLKQGNAPNEFGFSQAKAILSHGFPYSAVAHLVVSDTSPIEAWRPTMVTTVLNAETGTIDTLKKINMDMLPIDLINRSFGRLKANCENESLGLLAAYISRDSESLWLPSGRAATKNPQFSQSTVAAIKEFYNSNFQHFLDTPKY